LLVIELRGEPLGGLQRFERFLRQAILVHDSVSFQVSGAELVRPSNWQQIGCQRRRADVILFISSS
jgi:hypothetical protein